MSGLIERDRLRDLFGRHVGVDVARRAVEEEASLTGDVVDVAILFIDLVGSTRLTASHRPDEVAQLLNKFFEIVVAEVDQRQGSINKFEGDAALAVFGAPLRLNGRHLRRWRPHAPWAHGCASCRWWTSASASRPAQCLPAMSAPKTATNIR
ncbi:adenylate and Guanylate cyclase catalytic domain protein [Mycobacterium xenopi 4042]|uniref:Adenylate and Guanylate cyclase catalytic domain protein n=1 Tax=Mycobacterium xenopi 4042 TaxID=1299334 RepID=X8AHJ5_MYCXE|nr:adenylate and Guanylate cyclase catalytic domain protein [Mycobacterium xenopi 4042]